MQIEAIPLTKIECDSAFQVRLRWTPATDPHLADLVASLNGPEGLIHPIVVVRLAQPTTFGRTFMLIAGRRRLEAARRLHWDTILARVHPPCDLTVPRHQLQSLAMAVRENTEREPLHPDDRREALQRLKALYAEVYPDAAPRQRVRTPSTDVEAPLPFTRWAAKMTKIPEHTIRRDIRRMLLTGNPAPPVAPPAPSVTVASSAATPPTGSRLDDQIQHTCTAVQEAIGALQRLAELLMPDARARLSVTQFVTLHQTLEALQTALTGVWPVVRIPTEHPLIPFTVLAQEHLAALRGTLWGLRTGTSEAWATLPSPVARQLHTALATLLAEWQEVAPRIQARLPGAPPAEEPATAAAAVWQRPVALA